MATIGIDASIILDGTGYMVKPLSYAMHQARIRKVSIRADGGESYIDLGPGRREFIMVILCMNDLLGYDGVQIASDGQTLRDALHTSYNKVAQTINFVDPTNTTIAVYFDNLAEMVVDTKTAIISKSTGGTLRLSYYCSVTLVEA